MANRTVSVALVADVGQYQSAMVRAASSTKVVGETATTAGAKAHSGFTLAGRGAGLLAGVAGGALAVGLKSAVDAASAAEQSLGGVNAVFKSYARTVVNSSEEADRALGLSANSYRELATIIGSQLKNAAVPMEQLATKTEDIISIGADLAAQFGGSTQEAVEALSSAFRGELDPIERYGISLSAARVQAKAVEMGLADGAGVLDQHAKMMATIAIVTEQSADAQGAFAREADTAAGRAQRASAQWDNLVATLGEKLLPAWSGLMDILGDHVIPALGDVITVGADVIGFLGDLGGWVSDNTPLAAALGAVLAIQLAGGLTAVRVAANRLVLTNAVLGLSNLLGVVLNMPAALGAASGALGTFMVAAAPLVAIGAVVFAIAKTIEFATAASDAREEIDEMWNAVDDSRGSEQVSALSGLVEQLQAKIRTLRDDIGEVQTGFGMGFFSLADSTGDIQALNEYEDALDRAREQQDHVTASADVMGRRFGLTSDQVLALASKYDIDLTGSMSNTFRLMQNFYAMEFGAKPTEATIEVSNAFEDAKTAVDEAKAAVDQFKLSLDILTGAHVSMIQVESAFQSSVAEAKGAMDELNGSVLDGSGKLNLQSESGRKAADVLLGVRDSGNQLIATMIEQGASADAVRAKDAELRASFIRSAEQMGISRGRAEELADQILGIPAERETKIDADTKAANDKIAATQRGIDNLHGKDIEIRVRAAGRFVVSPNGGLQEFASGGWTGPGAKHDVAGVVHADEFVVPKHRVNALGGHRAVGALVGMPGYANGGPVVPINVISNTRSLEATMAGVASAMQSAAPADGVGYGGTATAGSAELVAFGRWLQSRGARVSEHPAFGGVTYGAHVRNSKHYSGRAIDVNTRAGTSALEQRELDPLMAMARRAGFQVLWRVPGHDNHGHVASYQAGTPYVPRDGLAYLHQGERVVPREQNLRSREFSGGGGSSTPTQFAGDLYLDSGEFLGKVRGVAAAVVNARGAASARAIASRPR